jgi:hypothetical protein
MRRRRLGAGWWLAAGVLVAVAGSLLVVAGLTAGVLRAGDGPLGRSADQVTVLGGALTVAGLACSAGRTAWRRLRGSAAAVPDLDLVRVQVAAREQEVKAALLAGLVPANLAYASIAGAVRADGRGTRRGTAGAVSALQRAVGGLLRYAAPGGEAVPAAGGGDLESVGGYFTGLDSGRLVVLGRPGAGKTVLAIELVLQLLRRQADGPGTAEGRVPVRLGAASWVPGQDLESWMAQRLVLDYRVPAGAAGRLVAAGQVMPVLDGLDEMDPEPLGPDGPVRALALLRELNAYGDLGRPGPVVVTCRAGRYEQVQAAGPGLQAGQVVVIGDLDAGCLAGYLRARYSADRRQLDRWEAVLEQLGGPGGAAARRVLATPWRLLLAITAAEDGADPGRLLAAGPGEDPAAAEQRIVADLLAAYIPAATRLAPRHGRRAARYQPRQVERWLRVLARHLDWQAAYSSGHADSPTGMTGIDIVPHLLWPAGGTRLVRGIHAALGLLASAAAAVVIAQATGGPAKAWIPQARIIFGGTHSSRADIFAAFGGLALAVILPAISAARAAGDRWPRPVLGIQAGGRFDWSNLALGITAGIVAGIALGIAGGIVIPVAAALAIGITAGIASGLAVGIAGGLGLIGESWTPDISMTSPMDALRRQLSLGLAGAIAGSIVGGLAGGLGGGLKGGLEGGLAHGLVAGFVTGLALGLAFGLVALASWGRYVVGQGCAAARRRLPARLGRFLSWAQESGLLRVSGATYQFRHRELQDWLRTGPGAQAPAGQPGSAPVPPVSPGQAGPVT